MTSVSAIASVVPKTRIMEKYVEVQVGLTMGVYFHTAYCTTVKPRCNEGPRDRQKLFAITRFRYIEVLFLLLLFWDRGNFSLYRRVRYIEAREIPLYVHDLSS